MPPRKELPPFTAGAHVDVHLPNGVLRSYSLLNSQDERHRYVIGVNKDAQSRGGSRYMHETLHAGDTLTIGAATQQLPARRDGAAVCVHRRRHRHHAFAQHDPAHAVARQTVAAALCGADAPERGLCRCAAGAARRERQRSALQLRPRAGRPDARHSGHRRRAALRKRMSTAAGRCRCSMPSSKPPRRCRPAWCTWSISRRARARRPTGGFTVELARTGRSVVVEPGHTILDCLEEIGIEPPYSCREGICGTCEVRVLSGIRITATSCSAPPKRQRTSE